MHVLFCSFKLLPEKIDILTAAVMLKVNVCAGPAKLNSARPGSTDDSAGMTNSESWSGNFSSPTAMPERPVVAGKSRVKGYGKVGP